MDSGFRKVLWIFRLRNVVFSSLEESWLFSNPMRYFSFQCITLIELFLFISQGTTPDFCCISSHLYSLVPAFLSSLTILHLTSSPVILHMISLHHQLTKHVRWFFASSYNKPNSSNLSTQGFLTLDWKILGCGRLSCVFQDVQPQT